MFILGLGIGAIEYWVVIPKVQSLETDGLKADLRHVDEAIKRELEHISELATDWGRWDETYTFVQDLNPDYLKSSLAEGTLSELSMDFLLLTRNQQAISLHTSDRINTIREALTERLHHASIRAHLADGGSGLVTVKDQVLMVSASPILQTDGTGPSMGMLFFGRLVDNSLLQTLEKIVSLEVSLTLDNRKPGTVKITFPSDSQSLSQAWLPLIGEENRSLHIQLQGDRPFFDQTLTSTYYLMGIIFVLGIIGTFASYFLLQHYLISPILKLQRAVHHFSRHHSLTAFDPEPRQDELGNLTEAFKEMARRLSADREMILNEREQLRHESLTDPLTGLGNRRYLIQNLEKHSHWANGHFLLVMNIDIDHFKQINDCHGHDAGDQVLREFAQLLKHCCRDQDFLIRAGGEEFIAICEVASEEDASIIAERIRTQAEQKRFVEGLITLTCSIGLLITPMNSPRQLNKSWNNLFKVADMALYRAKDEGRNRCVGWRHYYQAQGLEEQLPMTPEELEQALEQHILAPVGL
ncbi:sensor domain-containing diguanylate cyclase [Marinobacterium sediminicola]|uniref:sensor domain-containing diguanylate cyclase n=1 Tax=Marinobacterium sediminicola TaxID=518898 RepID=UPI001EEFE163|nr:diguanylate cyclase [Marinobacterium sediminicola]ULG70438.1 diguanylate cyclase [Marinobacterium sediminicola]